ncbi:unnamed protein product [Miscanthus lutarioriparius]|uniref:Uncharacterized protein n=1 Tax=Miscanthus lutarioriparius TaxID=422564 RepID=A0A811RL98_9POAL|nr:unnamed protein product [Miscanthus lutarioriparius]
MARLPGPGGCAGRPAVVIFVGAFFLTDTPRSLVIRGRAALLRVRGPDAEPRDIAKAVEAAIEYRPHLIVGFGSNAALVGAVILGAVNLGSLVLSTLVIDRYGRKISADQWDDVTFTLNALKRDIPWLTKGKLKLCSPLSNMSMSITRYRAD